MIAELQRVTTKERLILGAREAACVKLWFSICYPCFFVFHRGVEGETKRPIGFELKNKFSNGERLPVWPNAEWRGTFQRYPPSFGAQELSALGAGKPAANGLTLDFGSQVYFSGQTR